MATKSENEILNAVARGIGGALGTVAATAKSAEESVRSTIDEARTAAVQARSTARRQVRKVSRPGRRASRKAATRKRSPVARKARADRNTSITTNKRGARTQLFRAPANGSFSPPSAAAASAVMLY
jgi:vacuolar-type H+-ATPase subunit H